MKGEQLSRAHFWLPSPLGPLLVEVEDGALTALRFTSAEDAPTEERLPPPPRFVAEPLERYFGGELGALAALPVRLGGTDFQRRVWRALQEIPPGSTLSYGQLARHIGSPSAVRAVGLANGQNPVAVVVPCHRVIGANGHLVGYGGGIERKRWLLRHEGATLA
jgi:methylated-DNA-[protein]-cysteine S-methyltransferase